MGRSRLVCAIAAIGILASLSVPANASGGGNGQNKCSTLNTICADISVTDGTACSQISVGVQCTPTLVLTGTPTQPGLVKLDGSISWSGTAHCQYRERGDGLNNSWTSWYDCDGNAYKSGGSARSWSGGSAYGGQTVLQWSSIINYNTLFVTDCVEVHVWVSGSASATSKLAGVTLETTPTASARFPSSGDNLDGFCEGGSAY